MMFTRLALVILLLLLLIFLFGVMTVLNEIRDALVMLTARPQPVVDPVAQQISDHLSAGRQPNMNVVMAAGQDPHDYG